MSKYTDLAMERRKQFSPDGRPVYNCCQSVVSIFAQDVGYDEETCMKAATYFRGGMQMGSVCGAITGMCMAADLIRGPGEASDKAAKDEHYAFIRGLCDAFRDETGSIICRELLGLAPKQSDSPVSEPRTEAYYKKRPCAELVELAAKILSENLPD